MKMSRQSIWKDTDTLSARSVDKEFQNFSNTFNKTVIQNDSYVNVKAFGATGDGTTDDSSAVQAAISSLTNGGVLYFPAGTYKMSVTITSSPVSIVGDHLLTIFNSLTSSVFAVNYVSNFTANRVTIKDIYFKGLSNVGRGLYFNNMGYNDVVDCRFDDLEYGLYSNAVEWSTFTRCHVHGNKYGFVFTVKNGDVQGNNPTQLAQNSMEQYLFQCHVWTNTIGIYWDNINAAFSDQNSVMSLYSCTFLNNTLGLATGDGGVDIGLPSLHLYDCWFEENGTSGTQTFNGYTINNGDISLNNTAAIFENTLFETKVNITGTSRVYGNNNRFLSGGSLSFNIDSTVYAYFENSIGDDVGGLDLSWAESKDILPLTNDRPTIFRIAPRTGFVTSLSAQNVMIAPSTCSTGDLPVIVAGAPTLTATYGDGLYGNACVDISGVVDDSIRWAFTTKANHWYVCTFALKSVSGNTRLNSKLSGPGVLPNAILNMSTEWRTFATITQVENASTVIFKFILQGTMDFHASCFQAVEFANKLEALAFLHSDSFVLPLAEIPNRQLSATAAPTTGTWIRGDIVWQSAPAASGKIGFVCVSSGSPGTWKPFGAIDA